MPPQLHRAIPGRKSAFGLDYQAAAIAPFDWLRLRATSIEGTAIPVVVVTKR